MDEFDKLYEIEKALELLGLEKCNYCSSWDKKINFKDIRLELIDGAWRTERYCTDCQKVIIKNRSK